MGGKKMSFIAKTLLMISTFGASSDSGCIHGWIDEPEMPASLIEKK